jgi:hypothetical protein
MFLGRPPAIFTDDLIVPFVCLAWYLVHHTLLMRVVTYPACIYLIVVLFEIFRANAVMRAVSLAAAEIPAGTYYPVPLFGPVLIGTLSGTGGEGRGLCVLGGRRR